MKNKILNKKAIIKLALLLLILPVLLLTGCFGGNGGDDSINIMVSTTGSGSGVVSGDVTSLKKDGFIELFAVPDEGSVFVEWNDGSVSANRGKLMVDKDEVFIARFEKGTDIYRENGKYIICDGGTIKKTNNTFSFMPTIYNKYNASINSGISKWKVTYDNSSPVIIDYDDTISLSSFTNKCKVEAVRSIGFVAISTTKTSLDSTITKSQLSNSNIYDYSYKWDGSYMASSALSISSILEAGGVTYEVNCTAVDYSSSCKYIAIYTAYEDLSGNDICELVWWKEISTIPSLNNGATDANVLYHELSTWCTITQVIFKKA